MMVRDSTLPRPSGAPPGDDTAGTGAQRRDGVLAPFEDALRERFPSRADLLAEAQAQTLRRRSMRRIATPLLLAAAVGGLWWADPAWRTEEIRTAIGERTQWSMRDGSTLALNTGSVLKVETRLRSRRFVLEQGEAAFRVAHGWRPFIVRAGNVSVRDIGTVFNVRRQRAGAEVTVLEGAVEVGAPGVPTRTLTAAQSLSAGRQDGDAPSIRTVDVSRVGAWQEGRLVFDATPLAVALAEIGRYRQAPIALADAQTGRLRLSGAFDVNGIEQLIDLLPQVLPVSVARQPDGSVRVGPAVAKK